MTIEAFIAACSLRRKKGQRQGQAVWNELQKAAPEWVGPFRTGPLDCYYHTHPDAGRDLIARAIDAGVLTNPEILQERGQA